jgi:hypothetical protein
MSMSDIEPRRGARMTRRERERRAYRLVLAGSGLAALAVVGVVLAAIDIIGATIPVIAAILAVVCFVLLRQTLGRR